MLLKINGCGFRSDLHLKWILESRGYYRVVVTREFAVVKIKLTTEGNMSIPSKHLIITRLSGKLVVLKVQAATISSLRFTGLYLQEHTQIRVFWSSSTPPKVIYVYCIRNHVHPLPALINTHRIRLLALL